MQRRIGALILLVVSALLAATVRPAHAAPTPTPQSSAHYRHKYTAKVSPIERQAVKQGQQIRSATTGHTMDYRVAIAKYKGSRHPVNWRRQFVAGWIWAGGRVTHISSHERSLVMQVGRRYMAGMVCTGQTKVRIRAQFTYRTWIWANSCITNYLVKSGEYCVGAAGAVALILGKSLAPAVILGSLMMACGGYAGWFAAARDNSSVHAIILRIGDYWTDPVVHYTHIPVIVQSQ